MCRLRLAACLLCVISSDASAQVVKIVGVGASSCQAYEAELTADPMAERQYLAWAQGFLSAILLRAPPGKDDDLDLAPPNFPLERQAAFLRAFCRSNQRSDFSDGVLELYKVLRGSPT